jgi:polar amino acid transport system substrate-binding protein
MRTVTAALLLAGAASVAVLVPGAPEAASLVAIQERRVLQVCAHPDALPFSSQDPANPGVQLELAAAIARELGVRLAVDWIVFSRHARRIGCDAVMGTIVQAPGTRPRPGVTPSRPYAGSGYVLVVPRKTTGVRQVEDLQGGRVGVEHQSWAHFLLDTRKIATASFRSQVDIIEAVGNGEVSGGMVTEAYLGWYLKSQPGFPVKIAEGYRGDPDLVWNVAVGLRDADPALVDAVNRALDRLITDGALQAIFVRYGLRYLAPH